MRRATMAMAIGVTALVGALAACNGDDDAADETSSLVETTSVPATEPPPTTEPPATTEPATTDAATTTAATTTTTLSEEQLQQQIAADYAAASERLDELASNPTLEGLDEKLATISTPGSVDYDNVRAFITGMVERGEHVINGEPDYSTLMVESVELSGAPPYTEATVTYCIVTNRIRVDAQNVPQEGTGGLIAARRQQVVTQSSNGWLPSSNETELWGEVGVSECPPA